MDNETQTEETGSELLEEQSAENEPEQTEGEPNDSSEYRVPSAETQNSELRTQNSTQTPKTQEFRYQSPYINVPQTQSNVPAKYAHVLDDTQYAALREMASEIAEERVSLAMQAQANQRAASRQLGLPEDVINEYGDDMRRHEMSVPANIRGTKEGAMLAFNAALTERMLQTGDIQGVIRQAAGYFGDAPVTLSPSHPVTRSPLPPDQRMSTPRSNARPVSTGRGKEDTSYTRLQNSWGATDAEMKALMEADDEVGLTRTGGRR